RAEKPRPDHEAGAALKGGIAGADGDIRGSGMRQQRMASGDAELRQDHDEKHEGGPMRGQGKLHSRAGDRFAPVGAPAMVEGFLDETLLQIGERSSLAKLLLNGGEKAAIELRVLRFD